MSTRRTHTLAAFALALVSSFALASITTETEARANANGLAGYTGKPNTANPNGQSCNQCHAGGNAPTVTFNGPKTLAAGQVGDYTMVVTASSGRSGAGVAATDGAKLAPGSNLRDSFGELVQESPKAGASTTYAFKLTAPSVPGAIKLWGVGLASNGSGTGGDSATQTTYAVTVSAAGATTPMGGTVDGGTASTGTPSTAGSAGEVDEDSAEDTEEEGSDDSDGGSDGGAKKKKKKTSRAAVEEEDDGAGTQVTYACASSSRAPVSAGFAFYGVAAAAGIVAVRRRSSKRG